MKKTRILLAVSIGILMFFLVSCSINVGPVNPFWTITVTNNSALAAEIWIGDAVNPGVQRAICPGFGGFRQIGNVAHGAYLRIWWNGAWLWLGPDTKFMINANWDFTLQPGGGWVISER